MKRPVGSARTRAGRTVGLGESLAEVTAKLGIAKPSSLASVFDRWAEAVGEIVNAHVRPEKMDGDALVVSADSPVWASHVQTIAPELIERFRQILGPDAPSRVVVRVRPFRQASDQGL